MKLKLILLASVFALGFAFTANAGSVVDTDTDLVPDAYDNCVDTANGPGETSNQVDSNLDGYGNACDTDYDNNGATTTADFTFFVDAFTGTPNPDTDADGNGATTTADFSTFLNFFQSGAAPGPSGLACAGTIPCIP
ncbi:MAG: thrombospondin type 3 repeat-containing protein [Myxococcota bacterium]